MEPTFSIIRTYLTAPEAHAMQALLQSHGIFSVLKDEAAITMMPFLGNTSEGIKLLVHPAEAAKAISLLEEAGY